MVLSVRDTVKDDDTLKLNHAFAVTTAIVDGTTYLFAGGHEDNGISVFSVGNGGNLTNVENVSDTGTLNLDYVAGLTTTEVDGITYLFAAGRGDNGISVFSVGSNGSLTNVENVTDAGDLELEGANSVTTTVIGGATYLFVSGLYDDGISVFSVRNNGSLVNVENVADDGVLKLNGAAEVATAEVGGTHYLFVAGLRDDGVSVFSIGNDGSLTNVENVAENATLELDGARSVTTAEIGGTTYLFVAGLRDSGVSVFSVGNDGSLTNVDNVEDNSDLELQGARSVTTSVVGGATYLFVAGRDDDGISVFSVGDGGTLKNVDNVPDAGTLLIGGVSSVATADVGGMTYLFAAGRDDNGVSVFSVTKPDGGGGSSLTLVGTNGDDTLVGQSGDDVLKGFKGSDTLKGRGGDDILKGGRGKDVLKGGSGDDILKGGKGRDTLKGGADADIFIFNQDKVDTVMDFTVGEDLIKLKGFSELGAKEFGSKLVYDDGKLWYDSDGKGGKDAKLIAKFDDKPALSVDDFII